MFGRKKETPKPKLNKNATSMQRRLKTPFVLTYIWFHTSFLLINTGLFFLVNYALWILLNMGGKQTYLGMMSSVRVPNNYSPAVIRYIYYVDQRVVAKMLIPAAVMLAVGISMLLIKKMTYRLYVKKEVFREKEKSRF